MKILFIVDNLGAGGAERSLQELLGPLSAAGVRPIVACFSRRKEGVEHLMAGVDLRILRAGSRLAQMTELRKLAQSERPDLIHTTLFEADVFGRPSFLGLAIPIVTSLVNMPYEPARVRHDRHVNHFKLAAVRSLETLTGLACADHFHAISQAVKDSATQRLHLPARRITVVLRGRDPVRLGRRAPERRSRVRRELGLADDVPLLFTAGRQEYQKGQIFLIQAMAWVLSQLPNARLMIAGRRGSATESLRQAAAPFGERVRFLGHREDVPDLMAAADVFALPSLWEGLGCVVIEAMALELPIVASDLPPIRELVRASARLVPSGDARALADGVLEVLTEREAASQRAAAARERFETQLTIEKSAAHMLELFEHVVKRARSRSSTSCL